ncbi:MAG: hypothetical protein FWD76_02590 [Firmicutes bacterium]|nr:hypothetical protein [Bacillota bacterium]
MKNAVQENNTYVFALPEGYKGGKNIARRVNAPFVVCMLIVLAILVALGAVGYAYLFERRLVFAYNTPRQYIVYFENATESESQGLQKEGLAGFSLDNLLVAKVCASQTDAIKFVEAHIVKYPSMQTKGVETSPIQFAVKNDAQVQSFLEGYNHYFAIASKLNASLEQLEQGTTSIQAVYHRVQNMSVNLGRQLVQMEQLAKEIATTDESLQAMRTCADNLQRQLTKAKTHLGVIQQANLYSFMHALNNALCQIFLT